jgi:hypothetical protein
VKIEIITAQRFLDEIEFCKEFNLGVASIFDGQIGLRVIDDNGDEKYYMSPVFEGSPHDLITEAVFAANVKKAIDANEDKYTDPPKWCPS